MKKGMILVALVTGILCLAPVRGFQGRRNLPCASRGHVPDRAAMPVELLWWRPDAL